MISYIKILESVYQFLKNKKGSTRTVIATTLFLRLNFREIISLQY